MADREKWLADVARYVRRDRARMELRVRRGRSKMYLRHCDRDGLVNDTIWGVVAVYGRADGLVVLALVQVEEAERTLAREG